MIIRKTIENKEASDGYLAFRGYSEVKIKYYLFGIKIYQSKSIVIPNEEYKWNPVTRELDQKTKADS